MAKVVKKKGKANDEETKTTGAGRGKKAIADSGGKAKKAAPGKKGAEKKGKETEEGNLTEEYIEGLYELMDSLREEMDKSIKNASAARRARKLTSELAKQFKEFRSISIAHHKK